MFLHPPAYGARMLDGSCPAAAQTLKHLHRRGHLTPIILPVRHMDGGAADAAHVG